MPKQPRFGSSTLSLTYKQYKRPKYAYDRSFQPPHMAELRMKQGFMTPQSARQIQKTLRLKAMGIAREPMPSMAELKVGRQKFNKSRGLAWSGHAKRRRAKA